MPVHSGHFTFQTMQLFPIEILLQQFQTYHAIPMPNILKSCRLLLTSRTFDKIVSIVKLLEQTRYMSDEWFEAVESLNDVVYETYDIGRAKSGYIDAQMRRYNPGSGIIIDRNSGET